MSSVADPERARRPRAPSGNVSLSAVADLAGVSEATVSRVINRKYGVSASTRDAVLAALREVGYERSVAGSLVLLLVPNLQDAFFGLLCVRLEEALAPHGFRSIVCPVAPGSAKESDYVQSLLDSGIVAAVFVSSGNTLQHADQAARDLRSRGIPFVGIDGAFSELPAPVYSTDDWRAAEIAVRHLYDLGHRRIGMCAGPVGNIPADRRVEGFVQVMDTLDLPSPEDAVARHNYTFEGGRSAAEELLDQGITAIVAASDEMALGAVRAAHRRGLNVPGDLSVIGYNDSDILDYTDPPLTTVRQPVERLATNTARAIVALIGHREVHSDEVLIEPELRVRASTGPVFTE